jgi:ATP-dependent DNA helicase RecG
VPELRLNSPLQYIKGVGPRKAAVLAKAGLETVVDILQYYPRQYLDRSNIVPIDDLVVDEPATIVGEVKAHGILHGRKRRYEVILADKTGNIPLVFFAGVKFWERLFKKGMMFAATGTPGYFQGMQMVHPDLERLDENSDQMVHAGRIIPVYPQTSELSKVGLSSKGIRNITNFIFEHLVGQLDDPLPPAFRARHKLMSRHEAVSKTHYPDDRDQLEKCRRRLAFDELLELQFMVAQNKGRKASIVKKHRYKKPGDSFKRFMKNLPYTLTSGQSKAVAEITNDLQTTRPMSRLLHGDVGCGKTAVAVLAALYAAENNLQCGFMAPTEILAEQHFRNWAEPLSAVGLKADLLTASLKAANKKAVAARCASGETNILFGTHALIYDYVSFDRLGLIIIDEQHRFGVEQRGKLYAKGEDPDLLAMTATPIPRSLALTLYGDLDISTIEGLPPGRQPIRTVWRMDDVRDKVWQYVRDEVTKGGQAYIIYPLIDKSEQVELENVEDAFETLSKGPFRNLRLEMVHGRVKAAVRDDILTRFRERQVDILLATTVIEVGIDNPNANMLVVEHAERFGLAQLHQLRGRVGRGEKQSTAVAIAHPPVSQIARQRLDYFAQHTDGFQIAEADLQLRGPGELFGRKQSGLPELRIANLWQDRDLMETGRALLEHLLIAPEKLDTEHQKLYTFLKRLAAKREINLGGG